MLERGARPEDYSANYLSGLIQVFSEAESLNSGQAEADAIGRQPAGEAAYAAEMLATAVMYRATALGRGLQTVALRGVIAELPPAGADNLERLLDSPDVRYLSAPARLAVTSVLSAVQSLRQQRDRNRDAF